MDDKKLSAFDLDKLREEFKEWVRERNVPASDWTEFAKQFLKQITADEPGETLIRRSRRIQSKLRMDARLLGR